tara:strand:- start:228 stop:425 length:198 start_codon:yes stop_codon:yes gene_type:complete
MEMMGNCLQDNWFMDPKLNTLEGIVDEYLKATKYVSFRAVDCDQERVKALRDMMEKHIQSSNTED